ncbi:MAG: hypothetical protein K2H48_06650 [Duncaniella sp.]|nr:hypothetical protein [Duncaniella sp.]
MKKILYVMIATIAIIWLNSCSQLNEPVPADEVIETQVGSLENDPLIANLIALNDSLLVDSQIRDMQSRGFWSKFKSWWRRSCNIIVADINGCLKGAGVGFTLGGHVGATVGGVVVGTAYSLETWKKETKEVDNSVQVSLKPIEAEVVELAYANVKLNSKLIEKERSESSDVRLAIPTRYKASYETGLYHNASLRLLVDEAKLGYTIEEAFTEEEYQVLSMPKFKTLYNEYLKESKLYDIDYYIENPDKSDRIIQLFIQALTEYPSEHEDVTYLIYSYIQLIEQDDQISESQKEIVYSCLSTAAYSLHFWEEKLEGPKKAN